MNTCLTTPDHRVVQRGCLWRRLLHDGRRSDDSKWRGREGAHFS